eukprot:TRINITY_DN15916_c0_g1_i1.p1 TRINITY_DN15916_c0_g1~~TRINITY_DN15916_c0_g1_i1.p1  ORF type:complete len:594 (+),score=67.92 TRINITY_DN15916_c0_g1_i1:387-2168(+)
MICKFFSRKLATTMLADQMLPENRSIGRYFDVNKLGSAWRVRQFRVRVNEECAYHDFYDRMGLSCRGGYSKSSEDRTPFGNIYNPFLWKNAKELSKRDQFSNFYLTGPQSGLTYPNEGYSVIIPFNEVAKGLTYERFINFTSRQTRALIIEGVMYSTESNSMIPFAFLFEYLETGGCQQSLHIMPIKMKTYKPGIDGVLMKMDIVIQVYAYANLLCMFANLMWLLWRGKLKKAPCMVCEEKKIKYDRPVPWYTCRNCGHRFDLRYSKDACPSCDAAQTRWRHLCWREMVYNVWTYVDLYNYVIFAVAFILRSISLKIVEDNIQSYMNLPPAERMTWFPDFGGLHYNEGIVTVLSAFNVFLTWFKLYKYAARVPSCAVYVRLFKRGALDLLAFAGVFIVVFIAFTLAFLSAFRNNVESFVTFSDTAITLYRAALGDFDYSQLNKQASFRKILAIILYVLFSAACLVVMLNVFISIVSLHFDSAKEDRVDDYYWGAIKQLWKSIQDRCRRSSKVINCEQKKETEMSSFATMVARIVAADRNGDGRLCPEEISALKREVTHPFLVEYLYTLDDNQDGIIDATELGGMAKVKYVQPM